MKSLFSLSAALVIAALTTSTVSSNAQSSQVQLICKVTGCQGVDSLFLFEFNGVNFKKIKSASSADFQTYTFRLPASSPRFYYVGRDAGNAKPLILGSEPTVTLSANCQQFQAALFTDSDLNLKYEELKNTINQNKNELSQLLQQLQAANSQDNIDMANSAISKLGQLDKRQLDQIDALKKSHPYLAKIAALNTYLSYQNHGSGDLNELEYFAQYYFQLADWKDEAYNYIPWVYESIKSYTQTLTSVGLPEEMQKSSIDRLLEQMPAGSRTQQLALGGVISALEAKKSSMLGPYANRFLDKYSKTAPEAAAQLQQLLKTSASFITGLPAPDFTMNDPDGKPINLSDFKGKVVLVDFWASWCGPCRRENPNVVRLYNEYRSKGFDILGVSLDRSKEPWLAAIEKDGLTWSHVSDLQGWGNAAAKLYGVSSIPHTVLLDKDGKIIARNLRGEALEAKLKSIFGG